MSLRRGFGKVALLGAAVVAMAIALVAVLPSLPEVLNPFKESEVDRTNPAVLHSLSDLADYHASTGELQVTVDVEKDVKYVPSIIKGERVIYEAIGTVDGVVDLSGLNDDSIVVDEDGTVTVILPHATLSKVTLDLERSKIVRRDRGLLDRIGSVFSDNPTSEKALQQAAEKKLAAAALEAGVLDRAEQNAADDLERILEASGAKEVVVRFADPEPSSDS